jgi:hypothetical protein
MHAPPHAHAPGEPQPPPPRDGGRQGARFPPPPKGVRVWAVGHAAGDLPVDEATEATEAKRSVARRVAIGRAAAAIVAALLAAAILATIAAATIMLRARVGR